MEAMAYPLAVVMVWLTAAISPIIYYFVGQLVASGPVVGGDYFTFAVIGMVGQMAMSGALQSFGSRVDGYVQTGTFETLLVEPVSWRLLPFGIVGWPIVQSFMNVSVAAVVAVALGINVDVSGLPAAIFILIMGIAASHAIGVLAASVRVLSKRSDPILGLYLIAGTVLSGVLFPISVLPEPVRVLSYFFPLTYVLAATRKVLMPGGDLVTGPSALEAVILLLVFLVVVYPIALWLFGRALDYGRKLGVLGGY
ncbi:MAG: ABC transporter permease [Acidimicrobiia bacterium]